jgi:hypothetical protein
VFGVARNTMDDGSPLTVRLSESRRETAAEPHHVIDGAASSDPIGHAADDRHAELAELRGDPR